MTKNDIMTRLQNGESAIDLANEFAAMLNGVVDEMEAQKAIDDKVAAKRDLAKRFTEIVKDYAQIECPDAMDVFQNVSDEDLDEMVEMLDEMFVSLRAAIELKNMLKGQTPTQRGPAPKTDDDILTSFLSQSGLLN